MLQLLRQLMPAEMALHACPQSAARLLICGYDKIEKPRMGAAWLFNFLEENTDSPLSPLPHHVVFTEYQRVESFAFRA